MSTLGAFNHGGITAVAVPLRGERGRCLQQARVTATKVEDVFTPSWGSLQQASLLAWLLAGHQELPLATVPTLRLAHAEAWSSSGGRSSSTLVHASLGAPGNSNKPKRSSPPAGHALPPRARRGMPNAALSCTTTSKRRTER